MQSDPEKKPEVPPRSVNPEGGVDPSAPTSGTEGYGMQPGEPGLNSSPAHASSIYARGAGDIRRAPYPQTEGSDLMENKSHQDELRDNPNNRQGKSLRCADVGVTNCNWSVTADSDDDIMRKAEQHARDAHGMNSFDENTRRKVHDAIRDRAA